MVANCFSDELLAVGNSLNRSLEKLSEVIMKKTCICIFFVVSCVFSLSAWSLLSLSPSRPECVTDELNKLLEQKHFEKDSDAIIGFTKDFSLADRQAIFDYYKLDGERAADDNYNWYFPCFGFGSFAEGDTKGGLILLASDIVFWGTAYTGTFMFCFSLFDMFGLTAPVHEVAGQTGYDVERSKSLMIGGLIAAGVGFVGGMVADLVYGGIRPPGGPDGPPAGPDPLRPDKPLRLRREARPAARFHRRLGFRRGRGPAPVPLIRRVVQLLNKCTQRNE